MSEQLMVELLDRVVPASERGRPDWTEVLALAGERQREPHQRGRSASGPRWRQTIIILAVAVAVAVSGVAIAASWGPFADRASLPRKPIAENVAALGRDDLRLITVPEALANLPGDAAPRRGTVRELATGLGHGNMSVYAWPRGDDITCFQTSHGSGGCQTSFFGDASLGVSDPDRLGAGHPAYVWGLVSDAVIGVNVVVDGKSHAAMLRNNVAFFELEDDAHPSAIGSFSVVLKDGTVQTIDY